MKITKGRITIAQSVAAAMFVFFLLMNDNIAKDLSIFSAKATIVLTLLSISIHEE